MAIVLISPRKRQKAVIWAIASLAVLMLLGASLFIFFPMFTNQINTIPDTGTYITPDIKLNFSIIDSNQVKNLTPFSIIETEFAYTAQDKNGKQVVGKISADDQESAKKSLEAIGLTVSNLQEINAGRSDPFVPY